MVYRCPCCAVNSEWAATVSALSAAAGLLIGCGIGPLNVIGMTSIQERVPDGMLGRVIGALYAMSQLATPLAVLLAGFGVEWFGVRAPFVVAAAIFTCTAIFSISSPLMRELERPTAADDVATTMNGVPS